ncbi:hypothetical protein BMJ22_06305, partial [Sinorhizobium medicae]
MLEESPGTRIDIVLAKLGRALERGDIDAAVNLFQADCYWRDLVAFTWNLKTMEGQDQIRDMLTSQLAAIKPARLRQDEMERPGDADGVTEG